MECKKEAKRIVNSDNAPRKPNGRKVGYMELMLELWNQKGHEYLQFTKQNLFDRIKHNFLYEIT